MLLPKSAGTQIVGYITGEAAAFHRMIGPTIGCRQLPENIRECLLRLISEAWADNHKHGLQRAISQAQNQPLTIKHALKYRRFIDPIALE